MATHDRLCAAVGRADITPPIGIPLVGYAGRGPSTGAHDPLTITALVLGCGDSRAAILGCDLLFVDPEFVDATSAMIRDRCSIPAENVLFCCSHTHYGPLLASSPFHDGGEQVRHNEENLRHVIVGLVAEAAARLAPVKIGAARGSASANINRREKRPDGTITIGVNPDGFVDREVIVVRIETDAGEPLSCIVGYQCHGTSMEGRWTEISSDFPGAMRQIVENVVGGRCLYVQGATGNMNPYPRGHDYRHARRVGIKLAGEAMKLWETAVPTEAFGLKTAMEKIALPGFRFESRERATEVRDGVRSGLEKCRRDGAEMTTIKWLEDRLQRAGDAVASWEKGEAMPTVGNRIHAVRFGPVALVSTAGELFAQIGVEVKKRSPIADTLFAGYTNGNIGYVPIPEAYQEGGYEVEHACRVGPEAAGMIIEACLKALSGVVR